MSIGRQEEEEASFTARKIACLPFNYSNKMVVQKSNDPCEFPSDRQNWTDISTFVTTQRQQALVGEKFRTGAPSERIASSGNCHGRRIRLIVNDLHDCGPSKIEIARNRRRNILFGKLPRNLTLLWIHHD